MCEYNPIIRRSQGRGNLCLLCWIQTVPIYNDWTIIKHPPLSLRSSSCIRKEGGGCETSLTNVGLLLALQLVHPSLASWWAGQIRLHLPHFEVSSSERARTTTPLDSSDGMHLPKKRGGCAGGLGSRGEYGVDGLFSLPYKDPKDTSLSSSPSFRASRIALVA